MSVTISRRVKNQVGSYQRFFIGGGGGNFLALGLFDAEAPGSFLLGGNVRLTGGFGGGLFEFDFLNELNVGRPVRFLGSGRFGIPADFFQTGAAGGAFWKLEVFARGG